MDHDANFVGDRLRLAAFLRVVELEMPQRPSRFKRRMQPVNIQLQSPARLPSGNVVTPIAATPMNRETTAGYTAQKSPRTEGAMKADRHTKTNIVCSETEVTPNTIVPMRSIFEIPRSPTPADPCSGFGDDSSVHGSYEPEVKVTVNQKEKQPDRLRGRKVRKAYCKATGSTSTRKRRLPVHGLALLRSTTTDGLPEPSDASKVFATPIEEIDPIRDCQTVPNRSATARRHIIQKLCTGTPQSVNRLRNSKLELRKLSAYSVLKGRAHVSLLSIADGFEAHEFAITRSRKSPRRKMNVAREPKATLVMPILELSSGPLPPPALPDKNHLPTPTQTRIDLRCIDDARPSGQLTFTKHESVPRPEVTGERYAQRIEIKVRNQLSCITAPVRRDTESSDSDAVPEHQRNDDEENEYSDGTDDTTQSSQFGSPAYRPTLVDDASYFEAAMHHLEVGREERAEGVSWSYQNVWV